MPRKKYVWDNESTAMTALATLSSDGQWSTVMKEGMADFERRFNYAMKLLEKVVGEPNEFYEKEIKKDIKEFLAQNKDL